MNKIFKNHTASAQLDEDEEGTFLCERLWTFPDSVANLDQALGFSEDSRNDAD